MPPAPTSDTYAPVARHEHAHAGRLIGAIAFGLVVGAGLFTLIYFLRRWRRRSRVRIDHFPLPYDADQGYPLEALGLSSAPSSPVGNKSPPALYPSLSHPSLSLPDLQYSDLRLDPTPSGSGTSGGGGGSASASASVEPPSPSTKRPRRERRRRSEVTVHATDAGPADAPGVTVLPPMYDPSWSRD
ncbi:hypothetical protein CC85DRAFT_69249 [Cutaneotrichosporon oleaginosum]|uniref:Uncharacterized protein n=1 Tax=Cutaneotrichosporon oleaginosum TaxID=879819 RepID=A0A0J0XPE6_9TREE|nr:uncharacterized protein CC85DRAFT_69249 [Cutaneotrichosporon oleaginosum]KLT42980.1 hypothetical protein CC85DRAFT_69249 [Cutaneotrichosporon oleaginosum]TXT11811.1 hypothetical protein COLE_02221 [Cutaneotrichosporon oleaginosum]